MTDSLKEKNNDYKGFPFFNDFLTKAGLNTPYEQYCLYLSVGGAMYASWTPVRKAIFLSRYLRETDESLKDIWAARANLSSAELKGGQRYLEYLKNSPKRFGMVPLTFLLIEGIRKLKNHFFNR